MLRVKTLLFIAAAAIMLTGCANTKENDANEKQQVKNAKINVQLGMAYLDRNDVNRAKKKLLTALEQAPNIPETWYSMAYFLESTGNKDQARKYYLKALALAPTRGDVQNNYGTFLCRSGEYQASIQRFMLAVKDPDYVDTSDAYENAGMCALKIPNKQLAYRYFNIAITQNPSRPISLMKLAEMDYSVGHYNKAKIMLDQYLAIAPATSESSTLMSKIKQHVGGQEMAEATTSVVDTAPSDDTSVDTVADEPEVVKPIKHKRVTYKRFIRDVQPDHAEYKQAALEEDVVPSQKIYKKHKIKLSAKPVRSKAHIVLMKTKQVKHKPSHLVVKSETSKMVVAKVKSHTNGRRSILAEKQRHHVDKAYSWSV